MDYINILLYEEKDIRHIFERSIRIILTSQHKTKSINKKTITDRKDRLLLSLFLGIVLFTLFQPLNLRPLRAEEPRRSIVAMEMEHSGNYLVPTINGMHYYNKPPVYNWVLLACFKLFGSYEEWVVRLPTVFSLLLTGIINFFFVRRYSTKRIALLSSLFYVLSADILLFFSMLGEIDMFFSMLVYVQAILIFHFFQQKKWWKLFASSYFFTAIGVLTKGVPSLAFQALTLLAIFIYNKEFKRLFYWQHISGILLLFGIVGAYFYAYSFQGDAANYLTKLFVESSSRTGLENTFLDIVSNFFRVPAILLKLFLPWSFCSILLIRKGAWAEIMGHPLLKFCFFFITANLLIYCLSPGTRERYLYMFLPFLGVILASFYAKYEQEKSNPTRILRVIVAVVLGLFILATIALVFIPELEPVSSLYFWAFSLGAAGTYLAYRYWKVAITPVWTLLLVMLLLRIGVNTVLIPYQNSRTEKFSEIQDVQNMVELVAGEPIYLAGGYWRETALFEIAKHRIFKADIFYATEFHFMMTYYFMRATHVPLVYKTDLKPNEFYVGKKEFAKEQEAEILYEFFTNGRDHCLFRLGI